MKPKNVEEYIATFPEEKRAILIQLREIFRSTLPDAAEVLKWGAPAAVEQNGMILAVFSGHKQHVNFVVTPSAKEAFSKRLSEYDGGKGSVQLAYDKPLPKDLLVEMLQYRASEYREHGIKWK